MGFVICPLTMRDNIKKETMKLVLQYRRPIAFLRDRDGKKLRR